jgi:excinuclease ABC subunit A
VSGSGKTTLVKQILYPALQQELFGQGEKPGQHTSLEGDFKKIEALELIDQNPIGKSSRSNPVTYVKAFDAIRDLFARQQSAKMKGLKPKHFSFNVEGGRCETCKGEGEVTIEMQFLADIHLTCEECGGKRFKEEVLEVTYNGKSIFDVLDMSVEEALVFFAKHKDILSKLQPLADVGLNYIKLGQSSSTLSGGEAQRVKLAYFLTKGSNATKYLFIFDEPTTGLHFHDINKLLTAFQALIAQGHSIVVIEHNSDVIKCADWVIDLGPEGGKRGGYLLFQGTPEQLAEEPSSYTGQYLKGKLA